MINFRGSTSYGQAFTDAIRGEWGGACYEDLERGFDHVLASYDFCDRERTAAAGGSFGGYMVNWIAGRTDRFRCMISHDGIFNTEMMDYATDELWFTEWEFRGAPWEQPEEYRKWSPHLHVGTMRTPTLVVQGEQDFRCPVSEGLNMFTALQRRGVPSRFLYFPDEGHWVLKPDESPGVVGQRARVAGEVSAGLAGRRRGVLVRHESLFLAEPVDRPIEDVLGLVLLHEVEREAEPLDPAVLSVGIRVVPPGGDQLVVVRGLRAGSLVDVERVDDAHSSLRCPGSRWGRTPRRRSRCRLCELPDLLLIHLQQRIARDSSRERRRRDQQVGRVESLVVLDAGGVELEKIVGERTRRGRLGIVEVSR